MFHEWFISWVKGIVDLALKGAVFLDVCDAAVVILIKRQLGFAEIGPVKILWLDESDYQRVRQWREG